MVWAATDKMTSSLPTRAMLMTFAAGILLATAFRFSVRAFSLPTGHSSIVSVLTATYPALVVVIGLVFLGEAPKVRPGWLSLGTILVLTGVVIITTLGQKN